MDKIDSLELDVLLRTSGPTVDELLDEFMENEPQIFTNGAWPEVIQYAAREENEQGVTPKLLTWSVVSAKLTKMGIPEKLAKADVYLSVRTNLINELLFSPHCDDISKIKDLNKNVADNIRANVDNYLKDNDLLLDALTEAYNDNWM